MNPDPTPSPIEPRPACRRRKTRGVRIGSLAIGSDHPVLMQSMTVSDTLDTDAVVAEIRGLVEAGCPLVRLTAPSIREAEHLRTIRQRLRAEGIVVPMVADIHYTPNAALAAAGIVEKVRINPGNYADKKSFAAREYDDATYAAELGRVAERFRPLVTELKRHGCALRIGVNHGSLSDRIMNRFGDTPEGMVESALEFLRLCEEMEYHDVVLSMKSSVAGVMIAAYRLLVLQMREEGLDHPLHLGVTEAGDGLEGRIKSAIGIGSLLVDGIGDTIRVSLTEDSRHEIAAARAILAAVETETGSPAGPWTKGGPELAPPPPFSTGGRRTSQPWVLGRLAIGGSFPVRVEERLVLRVGRPGPTEDRRAPVTTPFRPDAATTPSREPAEFISLRPAFDPEARPSALIEALDRFRTARAGTEPDAMPPLLLEWGFLRPGDIHLLEAVLPLIDGLSLSLEDAVDFEDSDRFRLLARLLVRARKPVRWRIAAQIGEPGATATRLSALCHREGLNTIGFLCEPGPRWIARTRHLEEALASTPDLHFLEVPPRGPAPALLAGSVLLDGIGDALCLNPELPTDPWPPGGRIWVEDPVAGAWAILQGCRLRLTRAEFIACPSCCRTQFDLQAVTAVIRSRTEHLKGVKIAIMGCVVNGPGEMADADFGYVGSGPGRVDLYVGRDRVQAGLREGEAPDRLVELIRSRGCWVDPPGARGVGREPTPA